MSVDKASMERNLMHFSSQRNSLKKMLDGLSESDLNYIPQGFNNNIIWNATHILTTQQYFCYYLSGNHSEVNMEMLKRFSRGTKPEGNVSGEEIEQIKGLIDKTAGQMAEDFAADKFVEYKGMDLGPNLRLNDINEALAFNNLHEGMHLGYIMAMKHCL